MRKRLIPPLGGFSATWTTLIGSLLLAVATFGASEELNRYWQQQQLLAARDSFANAIHDRIELYQYGLRGMRGAVVSAGFSRFDRPTMLAYSQSRDVDAEFKGARGFGVIKRVPVQNEADFIARARADQWPDFQIKALTPHNSDRFVIQYIEPVERNKAAVGLDIGSETRRRTAALEAVETNSTAITAPITLVQATGAELRSFLVLLPIYAAGEPIDTVEDRMRAALGWAYAPVVLDEVLQGIANRYPHLNWEIADVTTPGDVMPISARWDDRSPAATTGAHTIPVFNRSWSLRVQATPAYVANLQQVPSWVPSASVLTVGLLLTLLLSQRQRTAQRQRTQMRERAKLATIVDNNPQAAMGQDASGKVVVWNQAAAALLNVPTSEALGRSLKQVLAEATVQIAAGNKDGLNSLTTEPEISVIKPGGTEYFFSVTRSAIVDEEGAESGQAFMLQDITRRRVAERALTRQKERLEERVSERTLALQQAERHLRAVFDAVPVAIAHWDASMRFLVVNKAFVDMVNAHSDPCDMVGIDVSMFLPPPVLSALESKRGQQCEELKTEWVVPASSGKAERTYDITLVPDTDSGSLLGYYLLASDITEVKQSQAALEQTLAVQKTERQRLASILEGTNIGTWEWNVQTGETRFNERWADILGYSLDEISPVDINTWLTFAHPEDLEQSGRLLNAHFKGETAYYECEARMKHRNGHWVWVLDRGRVLSHTADGKPEWMFGTHQDITRRKAIEQALQRSEDFLNRVASITGTGGWVYDADSGAVSWDQGTRQISEVEDDFDVTLKSALQFYPPGAREQMTAVVSEALETGGSFDLTVPYITAKGNPRWIRVAGDSERDENGKVIGMVGAIQDITRQHQDAEALRHAKAAAESSNLAKSQFLANMSHEIRTPLNAILGIHHILEAKLVAEEQKALLNKALRAGTTLMGIVNDILDLAKIEAGEMSLIAEPMQPAALLRDLVDVYEPGAVQKGITISTSVDQRLPEWIEEDQLRLRQVVSNLLGNAIKFTTQGEVSIEATVLAADKTGQREWRIAVRDTGIGMAPEALNKLFKPFSQEDTSITRRFGGTGLGLSIVKNLVQMMGGQVEVTSLKGVGTEFTVTLPLKEASASASQLALLASTPITIGVLSNHASLLDTLDNLFKHTGWRGVDLRNNLEASYDLLIMDGRPDDDIQDAQAPQWRLQPESIRVPVVMLTDTGDETAACSRLKVPCKRLHRNATSSDIFNAAVEMLATKEDLQDRLVHPQHVLGGGIRWLNGVRILVVDDSELNQEIAVGFLGQQGATCQTCNNGLEAVNWLRDHAQEVDAVLMDIQMPVMDGLQATRQIRRSTGLADLPVLALSAGVLDSERNRAREAGLSAFLSKPLDPLAVVKELLKHVQPRLGNRARLDFTTEPETESPGGDSWPDITGLDMALARSRSNSNLALFQRLMPVFVASYSPWAQRVEKLVGAPSDASRTELASMLHKLRGSASAIGAAHLPAVTLAAEYALSQPDVDLRATLQPVVQQLGALLRAMQDHLSAPETSPVSPVDGPKDGPRGPLSDSVRDSLVVLRDMIEQQDLDALMAVDAVMPDLVRWVGRERAQDLANKLHQLRFNEALEWMNERASELEPAA